MRASDSYHTNVASSSKREIVLLQQPGVTEMNVDLPRSGLHDHMRSKGGRATPFDEFQNGALDRLLFAQIVRRGTANAGPDLPR